MKLPKGYNETPAFTGESERIVPGGYVLKIKGAKEETANGRRRLAIAFDIAEGDYAGYYQRKFDKFGGNWSGVYRQPIEDRNGRCSPFFKGLLKSIEESNNGYTFNGDEASLRGKLFGGLFREEEYIATDGMVKSTVRVAYVRSADTIRAGEYQIPAKKCVEPATIDATAMAGFTDISMEDCPF